MGYLYRYQTRFDLLQALRANAEHFKQINTRAWSVVRHDGRLYIVLSLLSCRGGLHGSKEMAEVEGPCYYNCPLSFLDIAPVANADWRACVRAYHRGEHPAAGPPAI